MDTANHEGLGLSVLVYVGAIFGALALLAAPVYYATRGEVHENPRLAQSDPLLKGSVISDGTANRFPLAKLQRQSLVDAETTAFLTPKPKKAEPAQRVASRPARRNAGTPMAELQTERGRPSPFLFNLF